MIIENKAETRNSNQKAVFQTSDPVKSLAELAHIMLNLRHQTRQFDTHFGYQNRMNKRRWEAAADKWLADHIVPEETESLNEQNTEA